MRKKNTIVAKRRSDGKLVQVLPDGSTKLLEDKTNWARLRAMTDEEVEEFAERYRIPLGTLRDWEQGRCEPDQPARAYLAVIAGDPEGVKLALASREAVLGAHRPRSGS